MKRAIIIVKGKVQKVRYRSKVVEIAKNLGVLGEVENLEDSSVRIFAEAEKEVLDEFTGKIRLKNHLIDVRDVSVSFEGATGEFSTFRKVISGTMYEVAERLDEAANLLERLTGAVVSGDKEIINTIKSGDEMLAGKQDRMLEKQDRMLDTQEQTISLLKISIDETKKSGETTKTILQDFHQDTLQRFDNLDVKYGKIAENMERILEELKEERKEFRTSIDRLVNAIIESRKND